MDKLYKKIDLFSEVLEKIQEEYIDEVDQEEVMDSAIIGVMQSLDPYSSYMTPEVFEEMQTETSGEFGGLGIEVSMEAGVVKVITPIDDTYSDMLNGISQVHARGAKIVGISQKNHELFDFWIKIPKCDELVLPLLEVIISQLISYHMATSLNYDPDHPQNLAKSVTVR